MYKISESKDFKQCQQLYKKLKLNEQFNYALSPLDRCMIFYEDGVESGMGVVGLESGKIVIRAVSSFEDYLRSDLMFRAVLHLLRDMDLVVQCSFKTDYLKQFGFVEKDGYSIIKGTDIQFMCSQADKKAEGAKRK